jgi:hypothetical protein
MNRLEIIRRIAIRAAKDAHPKLTYKALATKFNASTRVIRDALLFPVTYWLDRLDTALPAIKTGRSPRKKAPVQPPSKRRRRPADFASVPTGDVEPPDGNEEVCEVQISAALDEQDRRLREGTGDLPDTNEHHDAMDEE